MKQLILSCLFIISFFSFLSIVTYSQQKKDTFYLQTRIDSNYAFIFSDLHLLKKIHLYEDGIFDFEVFSRGIILNFSSGKWEKINDSTVYLNSDRKTFDEAFNRNKRQRNKDRYKFIILSNHYLRFSLQNKYAVLVEGALNF